MDLVVTALPPRCDEVEVVEHKGQGHPDSICDAVAEAFSVALARFYRERFGAILHHNVDKALLAGGAARAAFGGGEVTAPIRVFLAGRATCEVRGVRVPVDEIAVAAAKGWVREHMHALDPERHVEWKCLARGGSADLVDLFAHRGTSWLANDTSIGAGYAPSSRLERVVRDVGAELRRATGLRPEIGEDTKVLGVRRGERIDLTIACAFVDRHVANVPDYTAKRDALAAALEATALRSAPGQVSVAVNAADDVAAGRVYLTVTGTSGEAGDDGQVGRGNRVNGLITPYRPMSLEAAAGKNPVSHVGKLYNVAAHRIAARIAEHVPLVAEVECFLVSRIGRRVDDPAIVDVRVRTRDGAPLDAVREQVADEVHAQLASLGALADEIVEGRVSLF